MYSSDVDLNVDAVRIAREVDENRQRSQQLLDAEVMCNTLVVDVDGAWLMKRLELVRKSARSPYGHGGKASGRSRTFYFRSPQPVHNIDAKTEQVHYQKIEMPAGFRVVKLEGSGFKNWVIHINNNLKAADEVYVNLRYNALQEAVIVRKYIGKFDHSSGRRAETRRLGRGPDRSL